ncbi:MAG TPA: choice-of-anchor P family protein, partial [Actinopolymorphaceae bacterium]|nr:choice-of-anchor P family protein [Actinopolymorphaceae bacterium]
TSETNGISLLGGLVTSGVFSTSTRTTFDGSSFTSEQSTSVANLRILGASIGVHPKPNTRIDLTLPLVGNIGYVEINRQVTTSVSGGSDSTTTGLHVVLLPNNPFVPGGGLNLWVANSRAALTPPITSALGGAGYATQISLADGTVRSGPTALAYIPCTGSRQTNTVASLQVPGDIVTGGAATTTAVASAKGTTASAQVTDTIASLSALDGAITVDGVKAVATATRMGDGPLELSDAGSQFANLVIGGRAIGVSVAPNTTINVLGGAAQVTLHKVVKTPTMILVTMIEIVVKDETLGLPVGSVVQIGTSYASISPAS